MRKQKSNLNSNLIKGSIGLLVGVPLMGASASQINALSSGTAKTLGEVAVGLQGVSLIGNTLGSMPIKFKSKRK